MALTDSLPTSDLGGLTVVDERLILSGLIVKNADGTARTGVFPSGTGPLVTGRASMGYDVAPFQAAVSRTGTGVELLANDATVINVPTDAAPGANSRIDVIYVRSQFTANTDPGNVPIFGVAKGAAAAVPTKPAIPTGALELASAVVPSSATTTASVVITQSAPWTAAAGGIVPFRNAALLNLWTTAQVNQKAITVDNGFIFTFDGTSWVGETGWATLAPAAGWVAAGSGALRYRKVGDVIELLAAEMSRATAALTVGAGASITVSTPLPLEFRPTATQLIGVGSIGVAGNLGSSRWFVNPAGEIFFQSMVATGSMAAGGGTTNNASLGGGRFRR